MGLLALVAAAVIGLALVLLFLRRARRFVFGYLRNRNITALRALVADYLAGPIALDPAATRVNSIMDQIGWYTFLTSTLAPGTASIEGLGLAPPGVQDDDPRINELFQRGTLLRFGPERYRQIQEFFREQSKRHGSADSPPKPDAGAA